LLLFFLSIVEAYKFLNYKVVGVGKTWIEGLLGANQTRS
jgi:hypothetical protein